MMATPTLDTKNQLQTLDRQLRFDSDAVLHFKDRFWMARGDSDLLEPHFLVGREFGYPSGLPEIWIEQVEDGQVNGQTAHFSAVGQTAGNVKILDTRVLLQGEQSPEYGATVTSAEALLAATLETEPLPINKQLAQLILDRHCR